MNNTKFISQNDIIIEGILQYDSLWNATNDNGNYNYDNYNNTNYNNGKFEIPKRTINFELLNFLVSIIIFIKIFNCIFGFG